MFLNLAEFGLSAGNSVKTTSYPRFGTNHLTGSFSQPSPQLGSLLLNSSVPSGVRSDLQGRGHRVSSTGAYGSTSVMVIDASQGGSTRPATESAGRYAAAFSIVAPNSPPTANPQSVTTPRIPRKRSR